MKTVIKLIFIILMMGSSLGYGQVIRDIPAQKKQTAKEQMKGWSTIFDWGFGQMACMEGRNTNSRK